MKLTHYALILFSIFVNLQVKAQPTPERVRFSVGGSAGYLFTVNGLPYQTQIGGDAIASSPDWQLENPPPLDSATAAKTARRQLKQLVEDDASWQVDEVSLCRVTLVPGKWYYRVAFTKAIQGQAPKTTINLLVDFTGNSGKVWMEKSLIHIRKNMSQEEALAAIRLCDGVQIGSTSVASNSSNEQASSGVIWSFHGYDAIIALWSENGRVSRMNYWTRKSYENSWANHGAPGQNVREVTFYTNEKKVSISTIKQ
jgi:hypothetical protein